MWLFTPYGFFSAVCARQGDGKIGNPPDLDMMMVRARDNEHLVNLTMMFPEELKSIPIKESQTNDYRFRMFIPKKSWALIVATLIMETDYDNFKNSIDKKLPKEIADPYHKSCMSVWSVMYGHQRKRYGPGIYDKPPTIESTPLLYDSEESPFSTSDKLFPHETGEIIRQDEPSDSDEVIVVRDQDTGNVIGAIKWAQDILDEGEAYDDAVMDAVIPRVAHPEFERDTWSSVKNLAIPVW